jgi:hypothetical protein
MGHAVAAGRRRMSARAMPTSATDAVSYRSVALPVEHGGWGLLLEPLALGLALSPSRAGAALSLAAIAAFLARHPLKLVLADRRRGARYPRTALAERAAAAYSAVAVLGGGVALAAFPAAAVPLLLAAPLGAWQLWYDAQHRGRRLAPELMGSVALGSTAAAIALAGGRPPAMAAALWTLMALKAVTSVLYVRARLRLERAQQAGVEGALAAHVAALAVTAALVALGTAPALALAAFGLLTLRAMHGLSSRRRRLQPREVGLRELAYGVLAVALIAAGYLARG